MKGSGLAASERGVQLALAEAIKSAGVGATASILLVGHSQGGLIAANIAGNDRRVKGLVTFGAPISQLADKIKVPTVAIQHKNDIVPKLGLKANPLAENMVTVESFANNHPSSSGFGGPRNCELHKNGRIGG
jgi:pimeloyl-ACP methyl ester carboxylesterase